MQNEKMTATDRVKALLNNEEISSPLVSLWKHFPLEDREQDKFVARTEKFQEELDLDFVKLNYNGLYGVEDWGTVIEWPESPVEVGKVTDYPVKSIEDWNNLGTLPLSSNALNRELEYTKKIVAMYKGKVPVLATVFSPLTIAFKLCGPDLIEHFKENPDSLHRGLAVIANTTLKFVEELLEIGVDGTFFATQLADRDKIEWPVYEAYGKRYDMILLDKIKQHTWFNILHIHGEQPMFKELENYPVQAINWHDQTSNINLKQARAMTDKILVGGIDEHGVLVRGDKDELEKHLEESYEQVGDGRIMFGPGCVIPLTIPEETLVLTRKLIRNMKAPSRI